MQEQKQKALKLIEEADWDITRQMVGFLFDKSHLKGMVWNHIDMVIKRIEFKIDDKAEKELNDFITFFSGQESELNKKYDDMFKKDMEDIKKDDFIEIDELKKG